MSRSDDLLALHLARGLSVKASAKKCGVTARTAFRRLKKPEFKAKVEQVRLDILQRTIAIASSLGGKAVKGLHALLASNKDAVRLAAIKLTLQFALKSNEVFVLAGQIAGLQKEIEDIRNGRQATSANGKAPGRHQSNGTGNGHGRRQDPAPGRVPGQSSD